MRTSIDLPSYLKNWRADLVAAAERKRVEAMGTMQEAESIEADIDDLDTAIAALQQGEVMITVTNDEPDESAAIAALEPAPETPAPVQPDPLSAELRSVPGAEEEVRDQSDDEPAEHISTLTGDPAVEPESGLHGEPEPTELDAEPEYTEADLLEGLSHVASITEDPELQAAVARAEATLAQEEPAYVGLQDPDLDAEYEAMREREKADRKLHFSIFGKREEV